MKKVAITGVSGFIGRNLADYLVVEGFAVSGCDQRGHADLNGAVEFSEVDILNRAGLERWIRTVAPTYVVHLAARTDLLGATLADYAANLEGVDNIMQACGAISGLQRVIFASSRMVCRIDYCPNGYEDYCPPNPYGQSKMEGELRIRKAGLTYDWVMVRPTSIWGPGFGIPYRNFFDQIRKRRYVHPSGFHPRKSFGYIGNTVFQLRSLLDAPAESVDKKTFYLGDYDPVEVAEWANYIHRAFGLEGEVRNVPMAVLRPVAHLGNVINRVTGQDKAPLTTFRLNNLVADMVYPQLAELRAVTGDLPYDWKRGTDLTVKWMRG